MHPMASKNRDDFTERTKLQLAKRAGWLCSDPSCRRETIGANSDGDGEINLGIAAHICAAAPEGPRYDDTMTPDQRKSPDNGIWMCELHGRAVDARTLSLRSNSCANGKPRRKEIQGNVSSMAAQHGVSPAGHILPTN